MKTTKIETIPDRAFKKVTYYIGLNPETGDIMPARVGTDFKSYAAPIQPIWDAMTTTQKNIVRGFIKATFKSGLNVRDEEIEGEIYE